MCYDITLYVKDKTYFSKILFRVLCIIFYVPHLVSDFTNC